MKIENYREGPQGQNVVGIFDVYLDKSTETKRNIKLIKSKKGTHFLSFPSFSEEMEDGSKTWHKFYEFSSEKQKEFENAILDELTPYVRGGIVRFSNNRN